MMNKDGIFRGVLFDLDGTLLDTTRLILQSFRYAYQKHYQRDVDEKIVRAYFGRPLLDAMQVLGPDKAELLVRTYREYNLAHHDELVSCFTGMYETVWQLYNHGVAMAVVTSKTSATALRGLKLYDMDKYFVAVIGVEDSQRHKPDPEPVLVALSRLKLPAKDCLMVGDSPHDIISGRRAGVKTAAVRWTSVPWKDVVTSQPDFIINTPKDILSLSLCASDRKTNVIDEN